MDLGLSGKRALVCAGSKGLGRGCAEALAAAGVEIVLNARGAEVLERTAVEIAAAHGVKVSPVAADITTLEGRAKVIAAAGEIDILVTNAGGPPPGVWSDWAHEDFLAAIEANMLAPIALMQAFVPGMSARGWGRVVNITSAAVKAPIAQLGLSNTARCGLTGFVAGMARQVAPTGVTVNNLLPGIHATDRMAALDGPVAQAEGISLEEASARRKATIPARRYGAPQDFGAVCAFLCSQQAAFIVGQNVLVDGGAANQTL
ncbi:SDR family oxidoreductase [Rhodobacter maris]|uniref:3-oxoacyl-[acyl-carrier protein] reductase n=1 Tax=Rhodobacter maris TaxID=446682 RepID=A0A285S2S5_9RHOB|nr:SDR family oxidoreductase [Rhodobacter maris]SOB99388.1 3-oxoacyl-[acyl-carrier protein] reductase [Rhodobacter maris]